MKGAVAAGHPLTAEVGARVLAEGGNAVDACIAAAAVSWVTESPLTGPGGGGFMLVHSARTGVPRVLDFFVALPGAGLTERPKGLLEEVNITFAPGNATPYRVGGSAVAVPGAVAGLAEAHRLYATRSWADLLAPATALARGGIEVSPQQARLHEVLDPVLRMTPGAREIYGEEEPLGVGDRLRMPDLADTLDVLAAEGAGALHGGELGRRTVELVRDLGGCLTEADLRAYRVIRRRALRAPYRGHEFVSNPPPSSGGVLIAFALRVLDRLGAPPPPGTRAGVVRLAEVMREATRARAGRFASGLYRGGLAATLLADATVGAAAERVSEGARASAAEPVGLPSTTHISVVDADGNAASHSCSTGCGSGIVVPGTGIHLNNMLGEHDLNPEGGISAPGRRLTSMMSPSLVLRSGRPRLVLGSAGSARLRGAIVQLVENAIAHGMPLAEAIERPRVHLEGSVLHMEQAMGDGVADELQRSGYDVVRWRDRNIFFGGASVVALGPEGGLEAAGDPRRGGAGVVVA